MSLEEAAKAQVMELVEELSLGWGAEGLSEKAATVVVGLVEGLQGPGDYIRMIQALSVPSARPDARDRPSLKAVRAEIRKHSETLGSGQDGVLWCQVLAAAAVLVDPEWDVDYALRPAWCALPIWDRQAGAGRNLTDHVRAKRVVPSPPQSEGGDRDLNFPKEFPITSKPHTWKQAEQLLKAIDLTSLHMTDGRGQPVNVGSLGPILAGLHAAIASLNSQTATDRALHAEQIKWLRESLVSFVSALLARVETVGLRESNALWWGQSLFSKRQGQSYRDMAAPVLPWLMADDLLDVIGCSPDESVTAWYTETLRRLWPGIDDEATWAEHLEWLQEGLRHNTPERLPDALHELISDEATALPITRLLARVHSDTPSVIVDLSGLGPDKVKGVVMARQLYRERALARWFAEEQG